MNREEVIRLLIDQMDLSMKAFAAKAGIPYTTLHTMLNKGIGKASIDNVIQVCKALGVSIEQLNKLGELQNESEVLASVKGKIQNFCFDISSPRKVPVYGLIRAGEPIFASENIEDYVDIPSTYVNGEEVFGLKVIGDSMNAARIYEDDIVLVRKQDVVENGEIAIVLVDGENATVKRFYRGENENEVILAPHSHNPIHTPKVIDVRKVPVKILGKVISGIFNIK